MGSDTLNASSEVCQWLPRNGTVWGSQELKKEKDHKAWGETDFDDIDSAQHESYLLVMNYNDEFWIVFGHLIHDSIQCLPRDDNLKLFSEATKSKIWAVQYCESTEYQEAKQIHFLSLRIG